MNQEKLASYQYQVGGSLPTNAPTYVKREADEQLYQALKEGDFCYVLNSRQMGKSSLRVQTMQRLQSESFACVAIDITNIGTADISPEQWYAGIIDTIINSLELYDNFDLNDWWMQQGLLSPVNKLSKFFRSVLLESISQNIVIFIDEIDSVLSLKFKVDDFFTLIRECYNSRASQPEYERLTFVLLGVANISDLVQDKRRTPFNIGRAIELTGFQLNEAKPLAQGLAEKTSNPMALMNEVLHWTGGQPFLTQKLCKLILNHGVIPKDGIKKWLRELVHSQVINDWEAQDDPEHLKTIRDRILRSGGQLTQRLLAIYREVLQGGNISSVRTADTSEKVYLRLSGLVVEQQGNLRVYNHIYESIFNLDWVNRELKDLRPDFYTQAFEAWFNSNCEDNSYLLQGKNLIDALTWAEGKSLSNQDYKFIIASQKWEFVQVQKKTKRQNPIARIVLLAFLVLTAASGGLVLLVSHAVFSPDGKDTLSYKGIGEVWDINGKDKKPKLEEKQVSHAVFSNDGKHIVTVSSKGTAKVWDINGKDKKPKLEEEQVSHAVFSPDGKYLVTVSREGRAKVQEINGKDKTPESLEKEQVNHIDVSRDGKQVVTVSNKGTVKVWDINTGKLFYKPPEVVKK